MERTILTKHLDELLSLAAFDDYSNNGLQIEGGAEVKKVVGGVDGCMALFEAAAEKNADMVIVHHGISWGSEPKRFTGIAGKQLKFMFEHNISLYACHLPLDAHPELGNNIVLARMAGLEKRRFTWKYHGREIAVTGELPQPQSAADIAARMETALSAKAFLGGNAGKNIRRITVVSGGGGMDALRDAEENGSQMLITGEFTHTMYHPAKEAGISVLALGHYATETVGVKALLAHLGQHFKLDCEFIPQPTGL